MDLSQKVDSWGPYICLLVPVIALGCNVIAQIIRFRLSRGTHFIGSVITGFIVGIVALGAMEVARYALAGAMGLVADEAIFIHLPVYAALSYCFYNFAQLGQTSIRIRLYAEIAEKEQGLEVADIARLYNDESLMKARFDRLLESRDIVEQKGRFLIGRRRLLPVARIIFAAKTLLLGRESEFKP
jgi:hypothetical protein